jgi:HK97 family phage major capsid protein
MDAVQFASELAKLLVDGFQQLQNTALTTGTGTNQPVGLITALAASSPTVVVNTATGGVLVSGDVYNVQNQLPPRFQQNSQWVGSLGIENILRQFETAAGALKFPGLQNNPPTLLGRNFNELSNMVATTSAGSKMLVVGDFSDFVIVDRFPSSIEFIPNLFGANRRPTGQRGAFLWARVGSDSVVDNAFRMLTA